MKLTIASKLSIAFGVVLALLAAVGLLSVVSLGRARAGAQELADSQVVLEGLDRSVEYLLRERVALGHVWATGQIQRTVDAEEARGEFDAAWEVVRTYRVADSPNMVRAIELGHETYDGALQEAVALYEANPDDLAAVMARVGEADGMFYNALEPAIEQLRDRELARVQQVQASVDSLVTGMVAVASIAGASALVVAAAAAYLISRGIIRAAAHLSLAAESISRGDLDVPIEVTTGDEMEALAESIERMRVSLKAAIELLHNRQPTG
jgi:methyl-accepting chemotaxis protein